jgi:5'-nucleotidase
MKILLSNDDGWDAPGIQLLESVLAEVAEVWMVAPKTPQSGISHQMTFERPLTLIEYADRRYHLDGTPADCARVGLTQLGQDFDWVFSGVNNGGNLGVDYFISGTVAAAREATFFGNKAVAISQHRLNYPLEFDWAASRPLLQRVVDDAFGRSGLAEGDLVNYNLPDCSGRSDREIQAVEIIDCDLDRSPLPFDYGPAEAADAEPSNPSGESARTLLYRGRYNDRKRQPNKDVDVCLSGNVSAVVTCAR